MKCRDCITYERRIYEQEHQSAFPTISFTRDGLSGLYECGLAFLRYLMGFILVSLMGSFLGCCIGSVIHLEK
ncbi:hypothetical protein BDW59DRAFT_138796 [Aspergillus cavernicola]|uniref:Uncharacterized protein n=1 Tax=Aspergillus cavernicola TaxID=176166 RepID=A0ABR4IYL9_9EURO